MSWFAAFKANRTAEPLSSARLVGQFQRRVQSAVTGNHPSLGADTPEYINQIII